MKSQLKNFFRQLLVLMSLFALNLWGPIAQADASTPFSQDWINDTNYSWTLETSINHLKEWFTTKEDHREIDAAYNQLKKQKLDWKLVHANEGATFLLNGNEAFTFNAFGKESVTVNGKVVSFKKGVSFKKYMNDFTNAVKKKDYSLNSLFINEADAILPFIIGAIALGGIALFAANRANASGRNCQVPSHNYCENLDRSKFRNGRKCNDMPTNYQRRLKLVSEQFKPHAKFNDRANTNYRYSRECLVKFQELGQPSAIQICKCIHKKQGKCAPDNASSGSYLYGWNMKYELAEQTCMVAFKYWKEPCGEPPVDTPTPPTTCGKTQGSCDEPVIEDTPTPDTHRPKTDP